MEQSNINDVTPIQQKDMPAFPSEAGSPASLIEGYHQNGPASAQFHGISKRDYFAAKAMQGLLASEALDRIDSGRCAALAYQMADAMLKARAEGGAK